MDFVAIDFETTGGKYNAPISLGLVFVRENQIEEKYYSLIDPKERIEPFTIRIHGLHDEDVQGQREFPEIWKEVQYYFLKYPVVAHKICHLHGLAHQLPFTHLYDKITDESK